MLVYFNTYNKLPSKHDNYPYVRSLGYWIADMKRSDVKLTRDKYNLLTQIKGWKWSKSNLVEEFLPFGDMFALL